MPTGASRHRANSLIDSPQAELGAVPSATFPAMKDMQLGGLLGTSHGVFAWGMNPHEDGTAAPEPRVLVHLAPLP